MNDKEADAFEKWFEDKHAHEKSNLGVHWKHLRDQERDVWQAALASCAGQTEVSADEIDFESIARSAVKAAMDEEGLIKLIILAQECVYKSAMPEERTPPDTKAKIRVPKRKATALIAGEEFYASGCEWNDALDELRRLNPNVEWSEE